MNNLIYYPGFEIRNNTKLKFALLYFNKLRPIIPYMCVSKEKYLSQNARIVMNNTDLIEPYSPTFDEAYIASSLACRQMEDVIMHPKTYTSSRYESPLEKIIKWQNIQQCTLYKGKFDDNFEQLCINCGLAHRVDGGININVELANYYMSLLADVICKNTDYELFTDINYCNNFLLRIEEMIAKNKDREIIQEHHQIACDIVLPRNIEKIPLIELINLRNNKDFSDLRNAFTIELDKAIKNNEKGKNLNLKEITKINNDMIKLFATTACVAAPIGFALNTAITQGISTETLPNIIEYGVEAAIACVGIESVNQYKQNIKNKTKAKKYIARIDELSNRFAY